MELSVGESDEVGVIAETGSTDSPEIEEISENSVAAESPGAGGRQIPVGIRVTSQNLARHWQQLVGTGAEPAIDHEHYLDRILSGNAEVVNVQLTNDFLVELTQFVVEGVATRLKELRALQQELVSELLKFNS